MSRWGGVRRRRAGLRAAPDPPVGRGADGLRAGGPRGCRGAWRRCSRGGCTRCTCGSSTMKPRSCPPEDAAKADAVLAGTAGTLTFGKLRSAAHRLVLELDPEAAAAEGRRPAERRGAAVPGGVRERRDDRPGTALGGGAGLDAARGAAGPGPARRRGPRPPAGPARPRLPRPAPRTRHPPHPACPGPGRDAGHGRPGDTGPDGHGRPRPTAAVQRCGPGRGPANGPAGSGRGGPPGADPGPSLAALVTITIPWSTRPAGTAAPAEVDGFGLVDRTMLRTWPPRPPVIRAPGGAPPCCTPTARRRPRLRTRTASPTQHRHPGHRPGPATRARPATRHPAAGVDPPVRIQLTPITRGTCDHGQAETGYRPSRKLRHLVRARNARCTAPGCGRPAARCDLDHTIAFDQGGRTCECDLAPLAATTIAASKPRDGSSNSPNPAS